MTAVFDLIAALLSENRLKYHAVSHPGYRIHCPVAKPLRNIKKGVDPGGFGLNPLVFLQKLSGMISITV
jgi:hypothetical protein